MKRALRLGLVYLALGVVTNLAICWASAVCWPVRWSKNIEVAAPHAPGERYVVGRGVVGPAFLRLQVDERDSEPFDMTVWSVVDPPWPEGVWATTWLVPFSTPDVERIHAAHPLTNRRSTLVDARGWPMLAMESRWYTEWIGTGANGLPAPVAVHDRPAFGIAIQRSNVPAASRVATVNVPVLPLRPIWSGVVINSISFAFLWFACVGVLTSVRHGRRYRRGCCPRCAYDRCHDYSTACPECGYAPRDR